MDIAGWVATWVGMGDWSMNDRGDCDLVGVEVENTEVLPVLLLFAAIESKSSDALSKYVPLVIRTHTLPTHHFAATSKPRSKHSLVATRSSNAIVEFTEVISMNFGKYYNVVRH
jgi:hypothetical protein